MAQKAMTVEQEAAPGPKADGRRQRGTASAQRIIDATIRLIADEGLGGMTMQRIAQSIGSSNSLVVFHFGSKQRSRNWRQSRNGSTL